MEGIIAIVMVFSIPIIAIITVHLQKQSQYKQSIIKDELELERLKQENFLLETEKLRVELNHRMAEPSDYKKIQS
ncbi:hypothetical protein E2R51_18545 [Jeotgalibacillus sp. S-D1]|uniref:hypothetical protein n=1 Tax=Jeotgalibacillus sp. S-D1 TaxID=2552189 RepID=UPI00105A4CA9|nr:hypothetical protein [Jeotgalibacillus sp. S-D1]TDL30409.1 hypothetical protein E2R51_18545 [Jeotgalibacillus sp. S-D1]